MNLFIRVVLEWSPMLQTTLSSYSVHTCISHVMDLIKDDPRHFSHDLRASVQHASQDLGEKQFTMADQPLYSQSKWTCSTLSRHNCFLPLWSWQGRRQWGWWWHRQSSVPHPGTPRTSLCTSGWRGPWWGWWRSLSASLWGPVQWHIYKRRI